MIAGAGGTQRIVEFPPIVTFTMRRLALRPASIFVRIGAFHVLCISSAYGMGTVGVATTVNGVDYGWNCPDIVEDFGLEVAFAPLTIEDPCLEDVCATLNTEGIMNM